MHKKYKMSTISHKLMTCNIHHFYEFVHCQAPKSTHKIPSGNTFKCLYRRDEYQIFIIFQNIKSIANFLTELFDGSAVDFCCLMLTYEMEAVVLLACTSFKEVSAFSRNFYQLFLWFYNSVNTYFSCFK